MQQILIIRADASPSMGTGHVMRCMALAQAAKGRGMAVRLVGHVAVPWVLARLQQEGIAFTPLAGPPPAQEVPATLLGQLAENGPPDWLVLDGYHFGPDSHKAVREAGYKLLVIDDYAHLPEYSCDILLNQNIGAEALPYKGDIGQKLLGPGFALLREEFYTVRETALQRPVPEKATNLLLTLGGGNFAHVLPQLTPALSLPELAGCTLHVIAGATPEGEIRAALTHCPAHVIILPRVGNMPDLLLHTDLCITAGGSTCWELCCLGVPFLTVETAENQHTLIEQLALQRYAPRFSSHALAHMLSRQIRTDTTQRVSSLVPGNGCKVVLAHMHPSHALHIALATPQDCFDIYQLVNEPAVRAASCSSSAFSLAEHQAWYANRIAKKESPFFVVRKQGAFVGYVRYDASQTPNTAIVSIALAPNFRGQGLGTLLLQETARQLAKFNISTVTAWIKPENTASQSAFLQAEYQAAGPQLYNGTSMLCFTYHL